MACTRAGEKELVDQCKNLKMQVVDLNAKLEKSEKDLEVLDNERNDALKKASEALVAKNNAELDKDETYRTMRTMENEITKLKRAF